MNQLNDEPIIRYAKDREIFQDMDTESLMINHKLYLTALKNPKHRDSWPALKLGLNLCQDELRQRGIDISTLIK